MTFYTYQVETYMVGQYLDWMTLPGYGNQQTDFPGSAQELARKVIEDMHPSLSREGEHMIGQWRVLVWQGASSRPGALAHVDGWATYNDAYTGSQAFNVHSV